MPNCKKAFVPSLFNNTQSFITQFNYMKNNNNFKLQKKEDDLNDTTFDLSGSSFENDGLDNSLNSIIVREMRNSSYKIKNRVSVNKKNKSKNSTKSKSIIEVIEKRKKKFHFLKPFSNIKDEKLLNQLKKNGYDLDNTLI